MHFKWVNYMVFALNFNKAAVFFFLKPLWRKEIAYLQWRYLIKINKIFQVQSYIMCQDLHSFVYISIKHIMPNTGIHILQLTYGTLQQSPTSLFSVLNIGCNIGQTQNYTLLILCVCISQYTLLRFIHTSKRKQKQEELSPAFSVKLFYFSLITTSIRIEYYHIFSEKFAYNCVTALISS